MNSLPFHGLFDAELIDLADEVSGIENDQIDFSLEMINRLNFEQFNIESSPSLMDIDPDQLLLDQVTNLDCRYYFPDSLSEIINNHNKSDKITLMSYNVNSVPHNLENFLDVELMGNISNIDVFALCETKLNNDIENLYNLENFKLYTNNRNRHGGGVALYINNRFKKCMLRDDLELKTPDFETLFVEIDNNNSKLLCGSVYRPPNGNLNNFLELLSDLLDKIASENKKCYIMGDLNINLLEYDSNNIVRDTVALLNSKYFYNSINKPTRVTLHSATIIDHLWTNDLSSNLDNGILYSRNSDHFPIVSVFRSKSVVGGNKTITYRNFNDENTNKFKQKLERTDWDSVYEDEDPNLQFCKFNDIFLTYFDDCFPLKNKIIKLKDVEKPYITDEIKNLIKEKNKLAIKFSRYPLTYATSYRTARNRLNKIRKKAKDAYYRSKFNDYMGNSKKTWKLINSLLSRKNKSQTDSFIIENCLITDKNTIANKFNDFLLIPVAD